MVVDGPHTTKNEITINGKTEEQIAKYNKLLDYLKALGSVAVAYSSGVDSTFLLFAAKEALGEKAIAFSFE